MVKKLTQKKIKKVRSKKSKTSRIMRGGLKYQEVLDLVNDLLSSLDSYKENGYKDEKKYTILSNLKKTMEEKKNKDLSIEYEEFINFINIYLLNYYTFLVKKLASCTSNTNNNLDKPWRIREGLAFLTNLIAKCNQGNFQITFTNSNA